MFRVLTSGLGLLLLCGCASVETVNHRSFSRVVERTEPTVGSIAQSTLGETLIRQGRTHISPAIKLLHPYRTEWIRNMGTRAFPFVFEAGEILRQTAVHNGVPIYTGKSEGGLVRPDGSQIGAPYGIGVTPDGTVHYVAALGGVIPKTPGRSVEFNALEAIRESDGNFRQEFIYSGQDEAALYFTYREFSSNLIRPAFTQNVTYSRDSGNVVAFKGLRLKVLSASNTEIRYQLLSGF